MTIFDLCASSKKPWPTPKGDTLLYFKKILVIANPMYF